MSKATAKAQAIADLQKHLTEGSTVYTILKHVSKSGMMRVLDVYVIRDNEPLRLTWAACEALGYTYNTKHEGMQVGGCGMDMGFHVVNSLSYALHGFPTGDNANKRGYTLKHRWLG